MENRLPTLFSQTNILTHVFEILEILKNEGRVSIFAKKIENFFGGIRAFLETKK